MTGIQYFTCRCSVCVSLFNDPAPTPVLTFCPSFNPTIYSFNSFFSNLMILNSIHFLFVSRMNASVVRVQSAPTYPVSDL